MLQLCLLVALLSVHECPTAPSLFFTAHIVSDVALPDCRTSTCTPWRGSATSCPQSSRRQTAYAATLRRALGACYWGPYMHKTVVRSLGAGYNGSNCPPHTLYPICACHETCMMLAGCAEVHTWTRPTCRSQRNASICAMGRGLPSACMRQP